MAKPRIRASRKSSLIPDAKILFEAENGENFTFTIKELVEYLVDDGSVVIPQPPAGVDNHGDLQNILGDGELHINQAQLDWIREQMYTAPTLSPSSIGLGTYEVGNYINYNSFLPNIIVNESENTTGTLILAGNNSTISPNSVTLDPSGQTVISSAITLTITNQTSSSPGNINFGSYQINERLDAPHGNPAILSRSIVATFRNRFMLIQADTDISTLSAGDVTTLLNASMQLSTGQQSTLASNGIANVHMVKSYLSSSYTKESLVRSPEFSGGEYLYYLVPTGTSSPSVNFGIGADVNTLNLGTANYVFNDSSTAISYNIQQVVNNNTTNPPTIINGPTNIQIK